MSTAIYWFRNDLRLEDNPALMMACKSVDTLLPIYIHEEKLKQEKFNSLKESFLKTFPENKEKPKPSLEEINEKTLTELVNRLTAEKAEDGQFDDCQLTFKIKTLGRFGFWKRCTVCAQAISKTSEDRRMLTVRALHLRNVSFVIQTNAENLSWITNNRQQMT